MNLIPFENLPTQKVKTVLVSGQFKEYVVELNKIGIKTITTSACSSLAKAEQYHADMQALHINKKLLVLKECVNLQNKLKGLEISFEVVEEKVQEKYPQNVLVNGLVLGDYIICNEKTVCKNSLKDNSKIFINVKQGYTKCSVAVVSQNAIITADEGIAKVATKNKIDVLKIETGHIALPEYNYGFIGGCSGLVDKNTLVFTGDITKHPNYEDIKSFCSNYRVNTYSLSKSGLTDIGSILPLSYE